MRALLWAAMLWIGQPPAVEPAPAVIEPPTEPGATVTRVAHLRVRGDIDSARFERAFGEAFERAASEAGLVVLELDGNKARLDLVWSMARRVRQSPARVVAYLADAGDRRVGLGQLMLGAFCAECYVAPGVRAEHTPSDTLRGLAPLGLDWDGLHAQVAAALRDVLTARKADPGLADVLVLPGDAAWVVSDPQADSTRVVVSHSRPSPRAVQIVFPGPAAFERVALDGAIAMRLGVATAEAAGLSRLLSAEGVRPGTSRTKDEIESDLPRRTRGMEVILDELRAEVARIEETLRVTATKLDRRPQAEDYRRAGRAARPLIDGAEEALGRIDAMIGEEPELALTPEAARAESPRSLLAVRRDLERLRAKAAEYESR